MPSRSSKRKRASAPTAATTTRRAAPNRLRKLAVEPRKFALAFPAAHEDYPWGERVVKAANNKVFVFLGDPYLVNGVLHCTIKLPHSRREVLKLPFAKPCGYGLGKHGWVTVRLTSQDKLPASRMIKRWIEQSHQTVAGREVRRSR